MAAPLVILLTPGQAGRCSDDAAAELAERAPDLGQRLGSRQQLTESCSIQALDTPAAGDHPLFALEQLADGGPSECLTERSRRGPH